MNFFSTRDTSLKVSSAEAIVRGLQLLYKDDEQFSPFTTANKNVGPFYKQQKSQNAPRFHGIIYAER